MESRKNPGLKANVISMYKSHFQREGFFRPKIVADWKISGKLREQHSVDIYFEFIQMNNLERTIIKTIEGIEVTEGEVCEEYGGGDLYHLKHGYFLFLIKENEM